VKVAIRVDASRHMGTGHLMRCLALADGLAKKAVPCLFVCRSIDEFLQSEVLRRGHELQLLTEDGANQLTESDPLPYASWLGAHWADDAEATRHIVASVEADWLITDHYAIDCRWHAKLRGAVRRIMAIDDLADRSHDADLLLDQSDPTETAARYRDLVPRSCVLLLGPRYALLRPEFAKLGELAEARSREPPQFFVCFGGSDPKNCTAMAIGALDQLDGTFVANIVVGSAHPAKTDIEATCRVRPWLRFHASTPDIAELMAQSALAVGGGGVMAWERLCVGLPSIIIAIEQNQVETATNLDRLGLAYYLGFWETVSERSLAEAIKRRITDTGRLDALRRKARAMVDGLGVDRVVAALLSDGHPGLDTPVRYRLRDAVLADGDDLFRWRNDRETRVWSRNTSDVSWDEHLTWLKSALQNPNRRLLIAENERGAVGTIRFDLLDGAWEMSWTVAPEHRGKGVGAAIVKLALDSMTGEGVFAEVEAANFASQRIAKMSGFRLREDKDGRLIYWRSPE
jgi:UDP-2,4-diacetamido-2,4,6-trideoxy-beta-L-altropyranose hydrolase